MSLSFLITRFPIRSALFRWISGTYPENGEWVSVGKCYGNLDTREGQLAVRLMDASWDVFFIEDGSHSKSSYKRTDDWSDAVATSGYRLSTTHEIEPGRAITLWAELGYSETNAQVAVARMIPAPPTAITARPPPSLFPPTLWIDSGVLPFRENGGSLCMFR